MIAHTGIVGHGVLAVAAVVAVAWRVRRWPRRSTDRMRHLVAWSGGVLTALLATSPPVESLADRSFRDHMIQHLLLIIVAAPLLVVGWPRPSRIRVPAVLRVHGPWRTGAPLLAAGAFVAVLAGTHLSPIYDLTLRHQVLHDAEHAAYLGTAIGVWATVARARRADTPAQLAAAFAVIAGAALVGTILLAAAQPVVPTYADRLGVDAALSDQRSAAALMWVSGTALVLPLLVVSGWRWAAAEQRRAIRAEALVDARDSDLAWGLHHRSGSRRG